MPKWIDKVLGIEKLEQQNQKHFEMLSGGFQSLSNFNGDAYSN